jgi:hypothetical protein
VMKDTDRKDDVEGTGPHPGSAKIGLDEEDARDSQTSGRIGA